MIYIFKYEWERKNSFLGNQRMQCQWRRYKKIHGMNLTFKQVFQKFPGWFSLKGFKNICLEMYIHTSHLKSNISISVFFSPFALSNSSFPFPSLLCSYPLLFLYHSITFSFSSTHVGRRQIFFYSRSWGKYNWIN